MGLKRIEESTNLVCVHDMKDKQVGIVEVPPPGMESLRGQLVAYREAATTLYCISELTHWDRIGRDSLIGKMKVRLLKPEQKVTLEVTA